MGTRCSCACPEVRAAVTGNSPRSSWTVSRGFLRSPGRFAAACVLGEASRRSYRRRPWARPVFPQTRLRESCRLRAACGPASAASRRSRRRPTVLPRSRRLSPSPLQPLSSPSREEGASLGLSRTAGTWSFRNVPPRGRKWLFLPPEAPAWFSCTIDRNAVSTPLQSRENPGLGGRGRLAALPGCVARPSHPP